MTDTPDIWPSRWPEPQVHTAPSSLTPVRPIGDRAPRFGVAHELDTPERPAARGGGRTGGPGSVPAAPAKDGAWTRFETWWASRDTHPVDLWHRIKCHVGRHRIEGGKQIQLGGRFVRTERCCVWCGHKPW